MSEILVALFMWAVVLCAAISREKNSDRSVLISSSAIAVSLTLNIDAIYVAGDTMLGSRNFLELVSDLVLMAGISFLLRGILRATRSNADSRLELGANVVLIAVCAAVILSFTQISASGTSTTFMLSFGDQAAAAAYSIIQFSYVGAAMALMCWVAVQHAGELTDVISRASLRLVAVGCACAVLLSVTIVVMDIAHAAGGIHLLHAASSIYQPLYISAIVLLCIGHSVPPVLRQLGTHRYRKETESFLCELSPLWRRTVNTAMAIPVDQYAQGDHPHRIVDPEIVIHRMVVEIRDATAKERNPLSIQDDKLLRAAETHLLAAAGKASTGVRH